MKIILASGSPRRKEILGRMVPEFCVLPSNADENITADSPEELVAALAELKAGSVFDGLTDKKSTLVIGADTVVAFENEVLGKPTDRSDAKRMLKLLSGNTHRVLTGVCLISEERTETAVCRSLVTFKDLTDDEIERYILSDEPYDKAGGYAVQGEAGKFVLRLDGSFTNVMGLPSEMLGDLLCEFGIESSRVSDSFHL